MIVVEEVYLPQRWITNAAMYCACDNTKNGLKGVKITKLRKLSTYARDHHNSL